MSIDNSPLFWFPSVGAPLPRDEVLKEYHKLVTAAEQDRDRYKRRCDQYEHQIYVGVDLLHELHVARRLAKQWREERDVAEAKTMQYNYPKCPKCGTVLPHRIQDGLETCLQCGAVVEIKCWLLPCWQTKEYR